MYGTAPIADSTTLHPAPIADPTVDFQSFNLGLYQEWIELDLFNYMVQRFSVDEFAEAGMNEEDISLLQFMANQEVGHATLLSNIVSYGGRSAAQQCTYRYYFDTVREVSNFASLHPGVAQVEGERVTGTRVCFRELY
jgi:hypothetical protein